MTYTPTILSAAVLSVFFAASPARSGPISPAVQFEFDEGSGTTLFNSGYFGIGSNGSIVGAEFSADSAFETGFSVHFDGDTDYVEIPDSFDYAEALTVEMWIKPNAVDGQRALYDDYGNPGVFMAIVDGELQWNISTTTHPGLGIGIFDGELCRDLWQHVAGTYDGSTLRAWVGGVQVGSVATSGTILDNAGNATHLGADSATPSLLEYSGKMDGFRVYFAAVPPDKPLLICGELTGDCEISSVDALTALRMAVALVPVDDAADVDASGLVSASDALAILRIAVGITLQTNDCNDLG